MIVETMAMIALFIKNLPKGAVLNPSEKLERVQGALKSAKSRVNISLPGRKAAFHDQINGTIKMKQTKSYAEKLATE